MRRPLSFALALALTCSGAALRAQPAEPNAPAGAGDKERGAVLFEQGKEAMAAGRFDEACGRFEESFGVSGVPGALLNWADCESKRGRLVTALGLWRRAAGLVTTDPERSGFVKGRISELEPRVPSLLVELAPGAPAGVVITVDGEPFIAGEARPIDGREHVVLGVAGAQRDEERVSVEEGRTTRVTLFAPPAEPERLAPRPGDPAPAGGSAGLRTGGWIAGAVGLAGVAAFGVSGAVIVGTCSGDAGGTLGSCPAEDAGLVDAMGVVNVAGIVVGAAGLGLGVALLVAGSDDAPSAALSLRPSVGGGTLGFSASF